MSKDFWNARYAEKEFAYGQEPHSFVVESIGMLDAGTRILELGAGEGRNAVFLAASGFEVTAVDYSAEGLKKTRRLAALKGVTVECVEADVLHWHPPKKYGAIVLTYLHLPSAERTQLFERIMEWLEPGGIIIGEWFHPNQLLRGYDSGGPKSMDLLVTAAELNRAFKSGTALKLIEIEKSIASGKYHNGIAAVTRFMWQKDV